MHHREEGPRFPLPGLCSPGASAPRPPAPPAARYRPRRRGRTYRPPRGSSLPGRCSRRDLVEGGTPAGESRLRSRRGWSRARRRSRSPRDRRRPLGGCRGWSRACARRGAPCTRRIRDRELGPSRMRGEARNPRPSCSRWRRSAPRRWWVTRRRRARCADLRDMRSLFPRPRRPAGTRDRPPRTGFAGSSPSRRASRGSSPSTRSVLVARVPPYPMTRGAPRGYPSKIHG